jgi:phosphocarrier protein HPr
VKPQLPGRRNSLPTSGRGFKGVRRSTPLLKTLTRREVVIRNRLGLHARAAARFVHAATRFRARVTLTRGSRTMDGKSILGILLLAASQGTRLEIGADGEDESQAVEALAILVEGGFGEEA